MKTVILVLNSNGHVEGVYSSCRALANSGFAQYGFSCGIATCCEATIKYILKLQLKFYYCGIDCTLSLRTLNQ